MSNRSPGSLRYLKARLRILKRPKVWGTVAGLLLTVGLVVEYFIRSGQLDSVYEQSQDIRDETRENEAVPDFRNPATGTDIDSLPVLNSVPNRVRSSQGNNSAAQDKANPLNLDQTDENTADAAQSAIGGVTVTGFPDETNGLNLLSPDPLAAGLNANSFNLNSPGSGSFIQSASPRSPSPANSSTSQPGYIYGIDGFAPQTPVVRPATPLQTAVDRYSTSPSQANVPSLDRFIPNAAPTEIVPGRTIQPVNPGQMRSNPNLSGVNPGINSRINSGINSGLPSGQSLSPYAPQTSPPLGTTGYTLPSTLNQPLQSTTGNPYSRLTTPQSLPRTYAPVTPPSNLGQPAFQGLGYGVSPGNANSNFAQPARP